MLLFLEMTLFWLHLRFNRVARLAFSKFHLIDNKKGQTFKTYFEFSFDNSEFEFEEGCGYFWPLIDVGAIEQLLCVLHCKPNELQSFQN